MDLNFAVLTPEVKKTHAKPVQSGAGEASVGAPLIDLDEVPTLVPTARETAPAPHRSAPGGTDISFSKIPLDLFAIDAPADSATSAGDTPLLNGEGKKGSQKSASEAAEAATDVDGRSIREPEGELGVKSGTANPDREPAVEPAGKPAAEPAAEPAAKAATKAAVAEPAADPVSKTAARPAARPAAKFSLGESKPPAADPGTAKLFDADDMENTACEAENAAADASLRGGQARGGGSGASASDYSGRKLVENPFGLVAYFCDPTSLISLTAVSHDVRAAALDDGIWERLCKEAGVADNARCEPDRLASAVSILEDGYLSAENSCYHTFMRVCHALSPVIHTPEAATADYNLPNKAQALVNAAQLAKVLYSDCPEPLETALAAYKGELQTKIVEAVSGELNLPPDLIRAAEMWVRRTNDADIKKQLLLSYFGDKLAPVLSVAEAFCSTPAVPVDLATSAALAAPAAPEVTEAPAVPAVPGVSTEAALENHADSLGEVNPEELEKAFSKLASALLQALTHLDSADLALPVTWKPYVRSFVISRSVAAVIEYAQEILQLASTKISELEYLETVPKIYQASQTLLNNSALKEMINTGDFDLEAYVEATLMRPILDEFCERQLSYVEHYASHKVATWNKTVAQKETETEQMLWSSVPKKSDKNKFISSLKWAFSSADSKEGDAKDETHRAQNELDPAVAVSLAPHTAFEAQTAVLVSKLKGMESLVSIELAIDVLECCRAAIVRLKAVKKASSETCQSLFCTYLKIIGRDHIQASYEKAIKVLHDYDPRVHGRLLISVRTEEDSDEASDKDQGSMESISAAFADPPMGSLGNHRIEETMPAKVPHTEANAVEPLAVFTELMNVGDLVQQMVHLFFEEELVGPRLVGRSDFGARSFNAKRKFEQMLDDLLAEGLSRGIDVLLEQVEFSLSTEQLGSDYMPLPSHQPTMTGPTTAARKVIDLVRSHLDLLRESTEKNLFDVFQQEVGVRLYTSLTKHLKRQHITIDGAVNLISDVNAYYAFIVTLRQKNLLPYYETLKQIAQLFLIETKYAKQIGQAISDSSRYNGLVTTEELLELIKRRQDWPIIKPKVEKVLYGIFECVIS